MSNRITPAMRFGHALGQIGEVNQGDIEGVVSKMRDGEIDLAQLQKTGASTVLDAGVLQLQSAVDDLNKSSGGKPKSLSEWYQVITGRTLGQTTEVKHRAEEITAAIDHGRPLLEKLDGVVGRLGELGMSGGSHPEWQATVDRNYKAYVETVNGILERIGPLETARRAGQLNPDDGARIFSAVQELSGLRFEVSRMGFVS